MLRTTLPTEDERAEVLDRHRLLVGQITAINQGVRVEWLGRFDDATLRDYLDRLERLIGRRGRQTRWERRSGSPAIVAHIPGEN